MKSRSDMLYVLLSAAVLLFAFQRCSDGPTEPALTSHDFVWEVDTIHDVYGFLDVFSIWGTSKDNVYLGGVVNSANTHGAWRWDGESWTPVKAILDHNYNARCIDGVDSSYIVFMGSYLMHNPNLLVYDEGHWRTTPLPQPLRVVTALKVVSRDEFYIAGVDGILKYKSGSWEWLLDSTDSKQNGAYEFYPWWILYQNGSIIEFASERVIQGEVDKTYLWKKKYQGFAPIDSFVYKGRYTTKSNFGYMIYHSGPQVYTIGPGGVHRWIDDQWILEHHQEGRAISGSNSNLFVSSRDSLFHYNGLNWRDITPPPFLAAASARISYISFVEGVLFVATKQDYKTIIYRGRQR